MLPLLNFFAGIDINPVILIISFSLIWYYVLDLCAILKKCCGVSFDSCWNSLKKRYQNQNFSSLDPNKALFC